MHGDGIPRRSTVTRPDVQRSTVDAARAGDRSAFDRLARRYERLAFHVARTHTGNTDDALDACQDALLKAWRGLDKFEGDGADFRRWLMRIVINACHDITRREARRPRIPLETERDGRSMPLPLPARGRPPVDVAHSAELGRAIRAAVEGLPPDHRDVVLLDQAGFDYAEMADILGIAIGTVKSRLSRARRTLRRALIQRDDAPDDPTREDVS